ncbi:hypothetical protein BKA64DRAFT_190734 [Cadophora sp. MPI-SDFR-AT-0126]|nr:hypothetical protein BKA64DRAFT_190734 [Leotiomycetes sp. MPI-SDFR-AT-0126]
MNLVISSCLLPYIQNISEAVYRSYLARDAEENTQKIFCRRFGAKYLGTREEDLNWIIHRIKLRTKEAVQGVLPTFPPRLATAATTATPANTSTFATSSKPPASVNHAAPAIPSQLRRTAPASDSYQSTYTSSPARLSQNTLLQSRPTTLAATTRRTAATTPQHAGSQCTSSRAAQTPPSQRGLADHTPTPPIATITPTRNVSGSTYATGQRTVSASTPSRGTVIQARNVSGPAPGKAVESPPVDSRKRGQTESMDFSERMSSRPRIIDSPELSSLDVTPTQAGRNTPTQFNSANRSISSTGTSKGSFTMSSHAGSRRVANTSLISPSENSGMAPRYGPRSDVSFSSMSIRHENNSGRGGDLR